jgi:hypothetical protein
MVGFERCYRRYGLVLCFMDHISGGVEGGDAAGVSYWKGLPTTTLVFKRQNCTPRHKSYEEGLTVMSYGNTSGNHKLKLVVIGKVKKKRVWSRVLKQTAFLYAITTRKVHGWRERDFVKLVPQPFCFRSLSFPERERITTESSVAARQCPF